MKDDIAIKYFRYLERMRGFKTTTMKRHKRIYSFWRNFLEDREKGLGEVSPADILNFIEIRSLHANNATISSELCIIRTFYAYLYDFGLLSANPAASIPELICDPPAESSYLTVEECYRVLKTFDKSQPIGVRNYTITALLWSTGLRVSELCALDWRDIDLDERALLVRQGKGGKQRQVFFNEHVRDDLRHYRNQIGGEPQDPVFTCFKNASNKRKNTRLSISQTAAIIRDSGKRAELDKTISPMTFRHCFATHMYEAGVEVADIKEMLGHDDETETTIYIHISVETVKRFLEIHMTNYWEV